MSFPMNSQMSDKTSWMFLDDLKHRKEKPTEEKVGEWGRMSNAWLYLEEEKCYVVLNFSW